MRIYHAGPLFTPYERAFIDQCASTLRLEGFDCFVPHEHEPPTPEDRTPQAIFAIDYEAIAESQAMIAVLDGPMVDDGTACEIGIFYGLMQKDPKKQGILGLITDLRSSNIGHNQEGYGINLFVKGTILKAGNIFNSIDECIPTLKKWRDSWLELTRNRDD